MHSWGVALYHFGFWRCGGMWRCIAMRCRGGCRGLIFGCFGALIFGCFGGLIFGCFGGCTGGGLVSLRRIRGSRWPDGSRLATNHCPDLRIALIGEEDSGKSTLLGVLTHGTLDDGLFPSHIFALPALSNVSTRPAQEKNGQLLSPTPLSFPYFSP
jgi:hypothetical protein